jgi:flagellar biosynthesis GTPase FlhF
MCVGAALGLSTTAGSGLFGLSAASAFNIGLGLTAANAFAGRAAAKQRADQTYNQALLANQSAEADKRQQQLALAERKSEQEKFAAQDKFAKTIDALQASRAIVASEQAGTTVGLLLMDQDRQAANYREKINQSLASMQRQYLFNIQQTESQFETRRNQLESNINEAYNAIPSLGQTLLNIGTQGVGMYLNALPS